MENQDAGKVCKECFEETKISYKNRNNFFGPLRGNMNKLGAFSYTQQISFSTQKQNMGPCA